ncbi:hypothetical protein TTRE_0000754601 [Trichuris trichiura]|uniref:SH3 domain-containing protein n=1 Tax=Trichuris trichiura TaxID=36087 RepID=A0A077ZFV0_TRITR|nr:hypothetical protein TTRE_0000754601 [Trichuris trichiura]
MNLDPQLTTFNWTQHSTSVMRATSSNESGQRDSAYIRINGKKAVPLSVSQSHVPLEKDELAVAPGDTVFGVYCYNNDWVYIVNCDGEEGFIPATACVYKRSRKRKLTKSCPPQPSANFACFNNQKTAKGRAASPEGLENVNRFLKTLSVCSTEYTSSGSLISHEDAKVQYSPESSPPVFYETSSDTSFLHLSKMINKNMFAAEKGESILNFTQRDLQRILLGAK